MNGHAMKNFASQNFRTVEELGAMTNLVARPKPVPRSRPTSQAYDLDAIVKSRRMPAAKKASETMSERSMFFRARRGNLDDDPFLQRLSRLT
jgi:hypothetical protein